MNALIIVDIQNDFLPGGALAVRDGDAVIPVANELMNHFDLVVATQDWHPANHESFAANHPGKKVGQLIDLHGLPQILWPKHCVQKTRGAELAASLNVQKIKRIFQKGTDPKIDSYSGFCDNGGRQSTGLGEYLKSQKVDGVFVIGLATDYCVKFTALDAIKAGFKATLVEDACRGVDLNPGDVSKALADMKSAGVKIVQRDEVIKRSAH